MTTDTDLRFVHNHQATRYELYVGNDLASYADYVRTGDTLDMHHTETLDAFRRRGLAAKLVRRALDDVRERKLRVVPSCWFVRDFITANPEYDVLLK